MQMLSAHYFFLRKMVSNICFLFQEMDTIDATLLQIVGLSYKMQQEGKISATHMAMLNTLSEKVTKEINEIKSEFKVLERKLTASRKNEAFLKRKFKEERKEVEALKAKNQKLEEESSTLQSQCQDLKKELDSSWLEDVSVGDEHTLLENRGTGNGRKISEKEDI